jgi:hypothetical protein
MSKEEQRQLRNALAELFSKLEAAHKGGDKTALLRMVWQCCQYSDAPEWVKDAFDKAFTSAQLGEIESWDDVFGKPYPKRRHREAIKRRARKMEVWMQVKNAHDDGEKIGQELFRRIGRTYGFGSEGTVGGMYYEVERFLKVSPKENRLWMDVMRHAFKHDPDKVRAQIREMQGRDLLIFALFPKRPPLSELRIGYDGWQGLPP